VTQTISSSATVMAGARPEERPDAQSLLF